MRLQPNIGSDRSWVWKVAADYSEQPPTSETLAIRFANSESESCDPLVSWHIDISSFYIDAGLFKSAFEEGQKVNVSLRKSAEPAVEKANDQEKKEELEENPKDTNTKTAMEDGKEEGKTD